MLGESGELPEANFWSGRGDIEAFQAKLNENLTRQSALLTCVGLISTGLAAVVGSIPLVVGAGFGVLVLSRSVIQAIPPAKRTPSQLVGYRVEIDVLNELSPVPPSVGIIGVSRAGKSTLTSAVLEFLNKHPIEGTVQVNAYIGSLPGEEVYIAYLDASGQILSQQFLLVESADILCIVIDHARTGQRIVRSRLQEQEKFFEQIRGHIRRCGRPKFRKILCLLNKRDAWQSNEKDEQKEFGIWFQEEVKKWKEFVDDGTVDHFLHSNWESVDVIGLRRALSALCRNQ